AASSLFMQLPGAQRGERAGERVVGELVEEYEPHLLHARVRPTGGTERDRCGLLERIAVNAGRNRRERNDPCADLISHPQRFDVTRREQTRAILRVRVHRSDGVNHPLRAQPQAPSLKVATRPTKVPGLARCLYVWRSSICRTVRTAPCRQADRAHECGWNGCRTRHTSPPSGAHILHLYLPVWDVHLIGGG